MAKKVLFLTGDRSDYELLYPLLEEMYKCGDFLPNIVVAGSHVVGSYGKTLSVVEGDFGPPTAVIDNLLSNNDPLARAKGAAIQMQSLCDVVRSNSPDLICVLGDREEALVGAAVGVYGAIPVIHIGGGDKADDGNSDNPVRDAVSKLSHVHLAASDLSAKRLIDIGEESWRVCNIGSTAFDRARMVPHLERAKLAKKLGLAEMPSQYVVLIYHPLLPEHCDSDGQVRNLLEALIHANIDVFISRPNSDPGRESIARVQDEYVLRYPQLKVLGHLERVAFVNLLRGAKALVGNSSAGIIESGFFKIPALNVGKRQVGREHGVNVRFVSTELNEITLGLEEVLENKAFRKRVENMVSPYGDGYAASRAVDFLRKILRDEKRLLCKRQNL